MYAFKPFTAPYLHAISNGFHIKWYQINMQAGAICNGEKTQILLTVLPDICFVCVCVFWMFSITDLLGIMYFDNVYINFTLFQPSLFWKSKKSALISAKNIRLSSLKCSVKSIKEEKCGPFALCDDHKWWQLC